MTSLAKEYSVNRSVIKRMLIENNIPIKSHSVIATKSIDENYFQYIDTKNKAYILGLIYADGCVTRNNTAFSIKLKSNDIDILYRMRDEFKSKHKIVVSVSRSGYSKNTKYCMLSIVNTQFVQHLIHKGVVMRKSKILQFPTPDLLPEKFHSDFVRGYFDGDGSVYRIKPNGYCISFTGTESMLLGIRFILNQITGSSTNIHKYKNKDIYDLTYGGRNNIKKIYNYLYTDADMFLERKYKIFQND